MIDFDWELCEMAADRNLMNSYKLYFLKALLINVSNHKREFGFYEIACWMCAYSFAGVCVLGRRIRSLDKLYDAAVLAIEKENLMQSSRIAEVYHAVSETGNKELRALITSLCNYVPYRLLAYLWLQELKGKTDKQKNIMIEELSRSESRCLYAIFSISQSRKRIEVNPEWASFITVNRERLLGWIDERIDCFVKKGEGNDIC
ncbi:MAG: hypothetical protein HFG97_13730 [Dorea sp.]|nr:hypothetical protein [Hungatella sp.]MCI9491025.1 hypothetical protein [Dorea sp.]